MDNDRGDLENRGERFADAEKTIDMFCCESVLTPLLVFFAGEAILSERWNECVETDRKSVV